MPDIASSVSGAALVTGTVLLTIPDLTIFPTNTNMLDNFNRADSNPLNGNWSNGYYGDDPLTLVSNGVKELNVNTYGGALYNTKFNPDSEYYVTVSNWPEGANLNLYLRDDGSNFNSPVAYILSIYSTLSWTFIIAPSFSTLKHLAVPANTGNGSQVGFRIVGNTLQAWHKPLNGAWSLVDSYTDNSILGKPSGVALEIYNNTIVIDDITGGTYIPPILETALPVSGSSTASGTIQLINNFNSNINSVATVTGTLLIETAYLYDSFSLDGPLGGRPPEYIYNNALWVDGPLYAEGAGKGLTAAGGYAVSLESGGQGTEFIDLGTSDGVLTVKIVANNTINGIKSYGCYLRPRQIIENSFYSGINCVVRDATLEGQSEISYYSYGDNSYHGRVQFSLHPQVGYIYSLAVSNNTVTLFENGVFVNSLVLPDSTAQRKTNLWAIEALYYSGPAFDYAKITANVMTARSNCSSTLTGTLAVTRNLTAGAQAGSSNTGKLYFPDPVLNTTLNTNTILTTNDPTKVILK